VASGGRLMLTRAFASLAETRLGYIVPDYTAYEDMIQYHQHRLTPVLLETREENGFGLPAADLARNVDDHDLGAFVVSNPCNPTGNVIEGDELAAYVRTARKKNVTLLLDEFYSHFIFEEGGKPGRSGVSAASHVEDVNRDPVLLIDGLTKSFRYPGWRLGWAVGPKETIQTLGRAASAIDGGPSRIVQRAALEILEPARADQETQAVRTVFARKRELMVGALEEMGMRVSPRHGGTFYCWACIEDLPAPYNDGETFFRKALERRVMTVPGVFFDVNPGKLRQGPSPFGGWTRFSYGPPEANVRMGLERLGEMLREG
jgi:hypothetical protein